LKKKKKKEENKKSNKRGIKRVYIDKKQRKK
jgi:hypothetical protein